MGEIINMQKSKGKLGKPQGTIMIWEKQVGYFDVSMRYNREDQIAYCYYLISAKDFNDALHVFNNRVMPEIRRKENLYRSKGVFDCYVHIITED